MHIVDIPFRLLPAPITGPPQPSRSGSPDRAAFCAGWGKNLPALPHGELESLSHLHLAPQLPDPAPKEADGCQYETSNRRPCPRPRIHYSDQEQPEDYCAAHLSWIEKVENEFDLPYPDSPQALLDLLAHTTAQVLTRQMTLDRALIIMKLVRAMERQMRWL